MPAEVVEPVYLAYDLAKQIMCPGKCCIGACLQVQKPDPVTLQLGCTSAERQRLDELATELLEHHNQMNLVLLAQELTSPFERQPEAVEKLAAIANFVRSPAAPPQAAMQVCRSATCHAMPCHAMPALSFLCLCNSCCWFTLCLCCWLQAASVQQSQEVQAAEDIEQQIERRRRELEELQAAAESLRKVSTGRQIVIGTVHPHP